MRLFGLCLPLLAASCLAGCDNGPQPGPGAHRGGRYLGIGTYPAGRMWSRMVPAAPAADGAAATTADDEQIIVTVDSNTGEVRQCGNLTGYCIGMNPWSGALGRGQAAPMSLREHAADADGEAERQAQAAGPANSTNAANAAAPAARPTR